MLTGGELEGPATPAQPASKQLRSAPNFTELPFRAPATAVAEFVVAADEATLDQFRGAITPQDPHVNRYYRPIATPSDAEALDLELGLLVMHQVPLRFIDLRR
ncbi:MAG: hypothetical protein ACKVVT_14725 [Dehalococcoidia bacterium]